MPDDHDIQVLRQEKMRLETQIEKLEAALREYANCRHGMLACACTKDARAALYVPAGRS